MTPIERACLYGIGLLAGIITIFRTVELYVVHLEKRYWARKKQTPGATTAPHT